MNSLNMIEDLEREIQKIQSFFENDIINLDLSILSKRPQAKKWSILECTEHMNIATRHYLKRLPQTLDKIPTDKHCEFSPGRMGEKMYSGSLPTEDGKRKNKMKTWFSFEPKKAHMKGKSVLTEFLHQQDELLLLLEEAKTKDLNQGRVTSAIGPIIRFKTGDAFRFSIAHNIRHVQQIKETLKLVI